jgi:hypothetical protein
VVQQVGQQILQQLQQLMANYKLHQTPVLMVVLGKQLQQLRVENMLQEFQ